MPNLFGNNQNTNQQLGWNVVDPKINPDPRPQRRVNLNPFALNDFILQQGTRIKVHRSTLCPNVASVDGAEHSIDCVLCNQSGWVDVDPLETVGVFQSQKLDKLIQIEGFVDSNLIQLTLPLGIEITYFTLIEMLDYTDIFFQRILRKEGEDVDVLKYKACRINVLIDANGVRYYQDSDFKIDINGDILWLPVGGGVNRPADNIPYSIHYEAAIQFRAIRSFHVNRFIRHTTPDGKIEHIKGPESWLVAKEFLIKRRDQNNNELKQGPYDAHVIIP